jgi:hypothetical protein
MIDAYQRGVTEGGQHHRTMKPLTVTQMLEKARMALAVLRTCGYAHLEPEDGFLSGYVAGYQAAQDRYAKS